MIPYISDLRLSDKTKQPVTVNDNVTVCKHLTLHYKLPGMYS